jgi:uncharacterized protein involved in response to NO
MSQFENENVRDTWVRWWELFNELLSHALTIGFLIGCIGAIQWFAHLTHPGEEIIFFKNTRFAVPLQYLLDAADLSMIICISAIGIYTVARGGQRK